jgi:hypothetical protein
MHTQRPALQPAKVDVLKTSTPSTPSPPSSRLHQSSKYPGTPLNPIAMYLAILRFSPLPFPMIRSLARLGPEDVAPVALLSLG